MAVVPLYFFFSVSVAQIENSKELGSISFKAITLSDNNLTAISTALLFANFFNPGDGVGLETSSTYPIEAPSLKEVLINIVPTNPIQPWQMEKCYKS